MWMKTFTSKIHSIDVYIRCTVYTLYVWLVHHFKMRTLLFKRWSSDVFWDGVQLGSGRKKKGRQRLVNFKTINLKILSLAINFLVGMATSIHFGWLSTTTNKIVYTLNLLTASNWRKFYLIALMEFSHSLSHFLSFSFHFLVYSKRKTQAKIHYLDIISGLPSYGAKCFSTNARDGIERVLLVSPRFGLSQIPGIQRNSVVSTR